MAQSDPQSDRQAFFASFVEAVNARPYPDGRAQHRTFRFVWRFGDLACWFNVTGGRIAEWVTSPGIDRSWDFSITAPDEVWRQFLQPLPKAPFHHLFGLWARVPSFILDGNRETVAQHAGFINHMMRIARSVWNGDVPDASANAAEGSPPEERIVPSFRHLRFGGELCRTYVEESGAGPDLLFLHTAGSDSRQYYHLLNDERLARSWRMVAFDLPGHGKSLPPLSWSRREYRLTLEAYVETVLDFTEQMGLKRPVVLGCSMAGALCLELARSHPSRFAAVIACEAAERIPGRLNEWLRNPRVDSAEFAPQWIDGLMSPSTPERYRQEILWAYSQAGAGMFFGDVAFYSGEFRMGDVNGWDTQACPVYMLTGEYDYSCTPEMSRRTAEKIPGARYSELKQLGHFPMAENPEAFMQYLLPILEELKSNSANDPGRVHATSSA